MYSKNNLHPHKKKSNTVFISFLITDLCIESIIEIGVNLFVCNFKRKNQSEMKSEYFERSVFISSYSLLKLKETEEVLVPFFIFIFFFFSDLQTKFLKNVTAIPFRVLRRSKEKIRRYKKKVQPKKKHVTKNIIHNLIQKIKSFRSQEKQQKYTQSKHL